MAARIPGRPPPDRLARPIVPRAVGQIEEFWVLDQVDVAYRRRQAELRLIGPSAYWFVEVGQSVQQADLERASAGFEGAALPAVRALLDAAPPREADGDGRISVYLGTVRGVNAYFSSLDKYPADVFPHSNERNIILMNAQTSRPGSAGFDRTLAHELQHLVHASLRPAGDTWLDEGAAELASALTGDGTTLGVGGFLRDADLQLTTWSQGHRLMAHYQAAYLFMEYVRDRLGLPAVSQVVNQPGRSERAVEDVLRSRGVGETFQEFFADWVVANGLNDARIGDGRFAYRSIRETATPHLSLGPDQEIAQNVAQFGTDYIELLTDGDSRRLRFAGAPTVAAVDAPAPSGRHVWWSNRADNLDSHLTRRFDLASVSAATLNFSLWFETERHFDYVYVMASVDEGSTWTVLRGPSMDTTNRAGNALGPGYTGTSGSPPGWLQESVDVTPFAGRVVLIRFEYATDQAYNARGALIDDIAIPEIGFSDDAESDLGWAEHGFVRIDNQIEQTWRVQLIEWPEGGIPTVRQVPVTEMGVAETIVNGNRAMLAVSGTAPRTTERAVYRLSLGS